MTESQYPYQYQSQQSVPGQTAPMSQASPVGQSAPASQPTPPKKPKGGAKTFLTAFLGAALACVLVIGGSNLLGMGSASTTTLGATSSTSISASDTTATLPEAVASKCLPSVVSVEVYAHQSIGYGSMYDYFFGGNSSKSTELTQTSLGSGVVLTEDGYIITNNHVVEGAEQLKVTVSGTQYDAELVGTDASSDVAVIKVTNANGAKFTPIEIGDSDNLTIGEWVMSIGSPFGLEQSVATGIVSATNRSQVYDNSSSMQGTSGTPTVYTNMIQTDAAINPGNSGGALVDQDGKLIGINTLITSYSGNYSGVGFAIPVNYAMGLAKDIIDGKTPSHAQLGVSTTTINSSIAARYGFSVNKGAYVSVVSNGSGAAAAGIQVGDIITSIDGKEITSSSDVMLAVRSHNEGDVISVTVDRSGQTVTVQATLGSDSSSVVSQGSFFGSQTN